MRLNRKLCIAASPLLIALVSYLFLLAANRYYASRAGYILRQIRTLKMDNSSIAEFKRLGLERGLRYEEADDCAVACDHQVSPNNQWMWLLLKPLALAGMGDHIGLSTWSAFGGIGIENGQVVSKIYGFAFYGDRAEPDIGVEASWGRISKLNVCQYYPLKRHAGYGFWKDTNGRFFRALVSDAATAENREHAFQFNLKCLNEWNKCDQFSELMPAAWADYQEDGKWLRAQRDSPSWQIGNPCAF